jgi:rubrerythrin
MSTLFLIDKTGDSRAAIERAFDAAGWNVIACKQAAACPESRADAVILASDAPGLGQALKEVRAMAQTFKAPVALVVDLDRSGWDRTFGSEEALDVDALFDKPVDAPALLKRIEGILAARHATVKPPAAGMASILDRAMANEEASADFYRQAAQRVSDPATRDALESLTRDEEEHKRLIEEFKSGARPLPEGDTSGGSLVETFGTPDFTPGLTPADAFLLAAKKEKLAVEFYENWAKLYPAGPERDLLLRLAEIERRHKTKVEAMFTNAAFPEAW